MSSLKKKIKDFVDKKVKEVKTHQSQSQQASLDYAQISRLFPESNFIPFTTWTISPSVILHILNDIVINKRSIIIEFGSGASTLYIAKLIQTLKLDTQFYSVESSEEWIQKMKGELTLYNLEAFVNLIHAPLNDAPEELCLQDQKLWYDTGRINDALVNVQDIDLVIVDGPFGGSTPFARYSAIPFLEARLSKNVSVFLDDTGRAYEDEIARQWAELLKLKLRNYKRYVYLTNEGGFITTPYAISKS